MPWPRNLALTIHPLLDETYSTKVTRAGRQLLKVPLAQAVPWMIYGVRLGKVRLDG